LKKGYADSKIEEHLAIPASKIHSLKILDGIPIKKCDRYISLKELGRGWNN
jgi:uncharacterized lipoprotein YehR (DUF1307 family)